MKIDEMITGLIYIKGYVTGMNCYEIDCDTKKGLDHINSVIVDLLKGSPKDNDQ